MHDANIVAIAHRTAPHPGCFPRLTGYAYLRRLTARSHHTSPGSPFSLERTSYSPLFITGTEEGLIDANLVSDSLCHLGEQGMERIHLMRQVWLHRLALTAQHEI